MVVLKTLNNKQIKKQDLQKFTLRLFRYRQKDRRLTIKQEQKRTKEAPRLTRAGVDDRIYVKI